MKIRTPNNIDVLLHFHCSNAPHPRAEARAVIETIDAFDKIGVLRAVAGDENAGCYQLTPLGRAWIEALCRTEIPQPAFVDSQLNVLTVNGTPQGQ